MLPGLPLLRDWLGIGQLVVNNWGILVSLVFLGFVHCCLLINLNLLESQPMAFLISENKDLKSKLKLPKIMERISKYSQGNSYEYKMHLVLFVGISNGLRRSLVCCLCHINIVLIPCLRASTVCFLTLKSNLFLLGLYVSPGNSAACTSYSVTLGDILSPHLDTKMIFLR